MTWGSCQATLGMIVLRAAFVGGRDHPVEEPDPTDQIVETDGDHVSVFVEQGAVPALDDKVLDAREREGQVGFVLANQT